MKPDASAQFRSLGPTNHVYMGGTAIGCGDHPTAHKRHRWSKVREFQLQNGRIFRDRYCLNCGLTKDA